MASGSRTTCARACSSRISRPNGTARVWGSLLCARRSRPTTGASPWRRRRAAAPRSPSSCPPREPARPARRRRDEHPQDGRGPARVGGVRDGGAANGTAGLAEVERDAPDAVLLDLMMPGGPDGLATLEQLKRVAPDLPVV